jgi:SSS family solute:Na+ symporter
MVALIATVALALSLLPLPGILALGRYSWAVVTLCFLLPLYFPCGPRELYLPLLGALGLHTVLVFFTPLSPEYALFPALILEWGAWKALARREVPRAA